MIYLLDTGPLVAAFRRPAAKDPFTPWAARLVRSLVAIDRADFAVYRRHGREAIPLLLPD